MFITLFMKLDAPQSDIVYFDSRFILVISAILPGIIFRLEERNQFLIALGAILKWAVTVHNSHGVNINTVGVILMIVGLAGLVITLVWLSTRRRTDIIERGPAGAGEILEVAMQVIQQIPRRTRDAEPDIIEAELDNVLRRRARYGTLHVIPRAQ